MDRAVVIKNVAPLRSKPHIESELADEVLHGMILELKNKENEEWYYIRTHYDYCGYIQKHDILIDSEKTKAWQKEDYIIWKLLADVMAEPQYNSATIAMLTRGGIIERTGIIQDKWEKIGLAEGHFGWIRTGFARKANKLSIVNNEEQLRVNIVNTAMDYLNTQYRWGGKSPLGIDCSGLASIAYFLNGITIPRDADLQKNYLRPIRREDAKTGDLFFFPGHVAVCIGADRYVHATGREGCVLINSFNPDSKEYREDLDKNQTGTGTIFGMEFD